MVEVYATDVAMPENLERLLCDTVVYKVVLDAFPFGHDMCGAGAGETVGEDEDFLGEARSRRENKAGEGVQTNRHTADPCGHH